MKKGNQEQICVKLDRSVSGQLILESEITGKPKNRIMNEGVLLYCNIARLYREYMGFTVSEEDVCNWLLDSAFNVVSKGSRR